MMIGAPCPDLGFILSTQPARSWSCLHQSHAGCRGGKRLDSAETNLAGGSLRLLAKSWNIINEVV